MVYNNGNECHNFTKNCPLNQIISWKTFVNNFNICLVFGIAYVSKDQGLLVNQIDFVFTPINLKQADDDNKKYD